MITQPFRKCNYFYAQKHDKYSPHLVKLYYIPPFMDTFPLYEQSKRNVVSGVPLVIIIAL